MPGAKSLGGRESADNVRGSGSRHRHPLSDMLEQVHRQYGVEVTEASRGMRRADFGSRTSGIPYRRRRCRALVILIVGVAFAMTASDVYAQRFRRNAKNRDRVSVFVEVSPGISNLFTRAEDGISRADWKFTIDCLQRVIDNPQGSLVPRRDLSPESGLLYESARRRAVRQLASLPSEGLSAYRLLFDGRAKRLFERGRTTHNPADLWKVVHRYLLSQYGDDAVDVLASWALDAGQPNEAIMLLTDLITMIPDPDVSKQMIAAKLAAAYALLGQPEQAWAVMAANDTGDDSSIALQKLRQALPSRLDNRRVDSFAPWPTSGGSSTRNGLMADVQPTIVRTVPWRFDHFDAIPDAWRRVYSDDPLGPLILPTVRPIADEDHLFTRTRSGCVALDRVDLVMSWRADVPGVIGSPGARPSNAGVPLSLSETPSSDASLAFEDYCASDISVAHGVVTILSREGTSDYTLVDRDKGVSRSVQWLPTRVPRRRNLRGTQIIAFDARTGLVRWQRGRSGHPDDPLGQVDFRSAPLSVAGSFWVPYFLRNDFYVAILDPVDGALIDNVLLCSIEAEGGAAISAFESLPPAASDGLVYIPSGHGILFGVDAYDHSLRWASLYQPMLSREALRGLSGPAVWLPGPPVVAGELVLIGAKEKGELLAFWSATGELRWSAQPEGGAYIIGADHARVWIGGRSISCVSLSDGSVLWTVEAPSPPTGRTVIAGDTLYAPLLDGLLSLDAYSGEALEYASMPADEVPLGNLLSLDHAMLITGPSGIRKFPDIDRSFPTALAQYESDPTDAAAAIRLAWLKLLRGDPQHALDVLERIPPGLLNTDADRAEEAARLRVEALLALAQLAKSRGGTEQDTLALLIQAGDIARSAKDRLRCGLAIGHQLATMGRSADAYERLFTLGIGPAGRQIVSFGDHVRGMARLDIARRLAEIAGELSATDRQKLRGAITEKIVAFSEHLATSADPRETVAQLRAIADLDTFGPARSRAFSAIASFSADHRQYERAEQLLREGMRTASDRERVASDLVELCKLYADATRLGIPYATALLSGLDELESRFADVSLDPTTVSGDGEPKRPGSPGVSVSQWVKRSRTRFSEQFGFANRSIGDRPLELTGELGWSVTARPRTSAARLVRIDEAGAPTMTDRVMLYDLGDVVSSYSAASGELLWKTELRLPETFSRHVVRSTSMGKQHARRAVSDGQVAVFSSSEGLFGLGLATGRRLWVRPFDATALVDRPANPGTRLAAADGLLAAMPNGGRLSLMRLVDGSTLWERDLRGESVDFIWMEGDRIVTADGGMQRVNIFDRPTGYLIRRVLFDQPDPDRQIIPLVSSGGVLCGPAASSEYEGIQGMEIATGEVLWQTRVDKPVARLFKPRNGYLGIGLLGGDVRIVDATTGELLVEHRVPGAHVVVDGRLIDGTLLVQHYASRDPKYKHSISALDIATGEEVWKRDDLISLTEVGDALRVFGGRLFSATMVKTVERRRRQELRFSLLDVRTGKPVGAETTFSRTNEAIQLSGDFAVYPQAGMALFGTGKLVQTLKIVLAKDDGKEGL